MIHVLINLKDCIQKDKKAELGQVCKNKMARYIILLYITLNTLCNFRMQCNLKCYILVF